MEQNILEVKRVVDFCTKPETINKVDASSQLKKMFVRIDQQDNGNVAEAVSKKEKSGYGTLLSNPKESGVTSGRDNRKKPPHHETLMSSLDQQPRQFF